MISKSSPQFYLIDIMNGTYANHQSEDMFLTIVFVLSATDVKLHANRISAINRIKMAMPQKKQLFFSTKKWPSCACRWLSERHFRRISRTRYEFASQFDNLLGAQLCGLEADRRCRGVDNLSRVLNLLDE